MSWLRGAGRRVAGVLAVACAGILSLAPAGGQAADLPGIYGADDRAVLDSAEWPWVAIGRVNVANGGFCTGTLIAPRLVLTAAHCLYDQRVGRWVAPDDVHFLAGFDRGRYAAHGSAQRVEPAGDPPGPGPSIAELERDWALVTLAEPMPVRPIPIAGRDVPADGMTGLVRAGYSQDRAYRLAGHSGCSLVGELGHGRLLLHRCDGTFGDSGSPILLIDGAEAHLVAMAVGVIETEAGPVGAAVPASAAAAGREADGPGD